MLEIVVNAQKYVKQLHHYTTHSMCSKQFLLGDPFCSVWGCYKSDSDMDDFKEPPQKKLKLFTAATSDEQMEKICKGFVPKNMQKSTNWEVKVFDQWRVERNKSATGDDTLCPNNLFECPVLT